MKKGKEEKEEKKKMHKKAKNKTSKVQDNDNIFSVYREWIRQDERGKEIRCIYSHYNRHHDEGTPCN